MGGVWRIGGRACVGFHLRAQHRSARPIIGQLRWKAIAEGCITLLNSQISLHTCSGVLAVKRVGVESRDVEQGETRSLGVLARASRGCAAIRATFINHDFTALSLGSTCFSPGTATQAICVLRYASVSHPVSVCLISALISGWSRQENMSIRTNCQV
jgi:hypothetical protein